MKLFPENTYRQLEFDKVQALLAAECSMAYAQDKARQLRIHTRRDFMERDLLQTKEFLEIVQSGTSFPSSFTADISREIKLLGISGATLGSEQFLQIRKLAVNAGSIFRWFNEENRQTYAQLAVVISDLYYEKYIAAAIDDVMDITGVVKDNASEELAKIRLQLHRKRIEQRRVFDRIVKKMQALGYLSDINESFMNGRRVLAVVAEQKRQIKGVLHSESDSRRTSYIEPEETTDINNQVFSLESEEAKEVERILKQLTASLSPYASLLHDYYRIAGEFDFIAAKAKLGSRMGGTMPVISDKSTVKLFQAYHPLLLLHNRENNKPTIPLDVSLTPTESILVVSGPNAGGKTITLKTVGLLQLMLQAGLLIPVSADSEIGIFKQLFIHIGDEQSIEFELSTYSSHLKNMKYFLENANGKTLFFIDELGGGSDPNLGGAFAEVILEELAFKHAFGIVTTHYLNLKVMAGKVKGIVNGAMQFDEKSLKPLYKLQIGKPGSSYTFSIAERIGLDKKLIERAKKIVDSSQYKLDKLLNETEQQVQILQKEKTDLRKQLTENARLKNKMEQVIDKEEHKQEVEKLRETNKINAERIAYLKDMERKLKVMIVEWRKTEDKSSVVKMIHDLLFGEKKKLQQEKKLKKISNKYKAISGELQIGDRAQMTKNRQVGEVVEIKGKKAILKVGLIPFTVNLEDLMRVEEKDSDGK